MKNVLKLILVLAVVAALSVSVFAATSSPVVVDYPDPALPTAPSDTISAVVPGASFSAVLPAGWTVEIKYPGDPIGVGANNAVIKAAAERAGAQNPVEVVSFDLIVRNEKGEVVHSGATINVTFTGLTPYVGKVLTVAENAADGSKVVYSGEIAADSVTVSLTSFSTFTAVVCDKPVQRATSPKTAQSVVPMALISVAVLAFVGALVANKQRKVA
jgi:hypothetical protein